MQRRFHYEQAFEHYLRANRVPYVAVDEARKTLLPAEDQAEATIRRLKSFDFVLYPHDSSAPRLLVDIKGRMYGPPDSKGRSHQPRALTGSRRFESWVTQEDVDSLLRWRQLFGRDFRALFIFAYCLRRQPPDALFEELFEFRDRWYALRSVDLDDYRQAMTVRSSKWQTVHVPSEAFARISGPFSVRRQGDSVAAAAV